MKAKKQPPELKRMVQQLRDLPEHTPPPGLHGQIMSALPARRGLFGRLEYALHRFTPSIARGGGKGLLPSTPAEYGITTVITGCFLLFLAAAFVAAVHRTGLDGAFSNALLALAPAFLGSILLAIAGWVQVRSPQVMVRQYVRYAVAGFLFGLSSIMGWFVGTESITIITSCLLGLSGLIITLMLSLAPVFTLQPRKAYRDEKSFVV